MTSECQKKIITKIVEYGGLSILILCTLYFALDLRDVNFFMPNAYYGDGWAYLATIQGLIERGFWGGVLHVDRLGAPTGAMLYDSMVYQQAGLHNMIMKLMGLVVPDSAFVINIYYIISYPLVGMGTYFFAREAGISRPFAVLASFLFAFAPYHVFRNTAHIYLSAYYMVPLAVTVVLWLAQQRLVWRDDQSWRSLFQNRRFLAALVILFLLATSDAYYTFFTLIALGLQCVIALFRNDGKQWRQISVIAMLCSAIVAGAALLVIPTLPEHLGHPNPEQNIYPLARHYYMANFNSLRLDTMILPEDIHRSDAIRNRVAAYQTWVEAHGENLGMTMGAIPALGFLLSLACLFLVVRQKNPLRDTKESEGDTDLLCQLSLMILFFLLIGISSGFGVLIAVLYPDIRCYARIGLFINIFSILTLCLILNKGFLRVFGKNTVWACMVAVPLMFFAVWDQVGTHGFVMGQNWADKASVESKNERYRNDAEFVKRIERQLPQGTMVFELPYVSFWTYAGKVGNIEYDHLVPFLHSKHLKWTFGSLVGTKVDLWQRRVASEPLKDFIREIKSMGFGAVYVDREGYADKGAAMIANLRDTLKVEPWVSGDDRRYVFRLPDPGFIISVDPYTYVPTKLAVTDRALLKPESLPPYIRADRFKNSLLTHTELQPVFAGVELSSLLDRERLNVILESPTQGNLLVADEAFRGGLTCPDTTITLSVDNLRPYYTIPVTVTNDSDFWWNFDARRENTLTIRSHLLDGEGNMINHDYGYQLTLGQPIAPHEHKTFDAVIMGGMLSNLEGAHELQLDIVEDGVAWFAGKNGNKPCTIRIIKK